MNGIICFYDNRKIESDVNEYFEANSNFHVYHIFKSLIDIKDYPQSKEIDLLIIELKNYKETLNFLSYFKRKYPAIDILVHGPSLNAEQLNSLLVEGVSGYVLIDEKIEELATAASIICEGGGFLSPKIVRNLLESSWRCKDSVLTEREIQVLKLMAKGKSYSTISDELFIARTTTKTHMRNIYSKLNVNNKSDAIQIAKSNKILVSFL